jgi:competence protein ComEC
MRPNLWILAAVILGIAVAAPGYLVPAVWLTGGLTVFSLAWLGHLFHRPGSARLIFAGFFLGAAFLFSFTQTGYREQLESNRKYSGDHVVVSGVVAGRPEITEWGGRFELQIHQSPCNGPRGKVTVYHFQPVPEGYYGKTVRVSGTFTTPSAGRRQMIPGFYERRRLTGVIRGDRAPQVLKRRGLPSPLLCADGLRRRMAALARRTLSPLNWRVLQAMTVGERLSGADEAETFLDELRAIGTVHLLSVSGLHVGFVMAGLGLLLRLLRVGRGWRDLVIIGAVGFYILMTGMATPVLRAGIMLSVYLLANRLGAADDPVNRLTLAALVLLLLNPYNLYECGFQLSFAATAGVVWLFPILKRYFPLNRPWLSRIGEALLLSISAQLLIVPVLIYYFQQISWVSPVANLVLTLPAAFIVMGGLAGELSGLIFPEIGSPILTCVDWTITLVRVATHSLANWSWAVSFVPPWPWPWLPAYYLGLILFLDGLRPSLLTRRRTVNWGPLLVILVTVLTLAVWIGIFPGDRQPYLEAVFFDVGQGDAILVKTPDNRHLLVDGGDEGLGRKRILPYLREHGITHLDYVVGTHGHQDHLGGLDEVLLKIPAEHVYLPEDNSSAAHELLDRLRRVKYLRRTASGGMMLRLGESVTARIFRVNAAADENDRSTVLLIRYGKYQLLLTGDLSKEGEEVLANRYPYLLRSAVLKVGHHGSNLASTSEWLRRVRPAVAVISVGTDNRFGHPGGMALRRLAASGAAIYRTDRHGTIRVRLSQADVEVIPEKGGD